MQRYLPDQRSELSFVEAGGLPTPTPPSQVHARERKRPTCKPCIQEVSSKEGGMHFLHAFAVVCLKQKPLFQKLASSGPFLGGVRGGRNLAKGRWQQNIVLICHTREI